MGRVAAPTMVGRDAELALLRESAAQAAEGVPTVVVVDGEAGIGKSRLVAEWAAGARDGGALVAVGRCVEVEGAALPQAPVAGLLRDLARQMGPDSLRTLAGPQWLMLSPLVPELGDGAAPGDAVSMLRLFDAMAGLLRTASRRGLVATVVEDVHWSDISSRDLVAYLARALVEEPVLVVLTTRPERPDAVNGFLAELMRLPTVDHIGLSRLDRAEVATLCEQLAAEALDDGQLEVVVRLSDGVPFLVEELVAAGPADGKAVPGHAADLLLHRWSALSPPAREVVAAASLADAELTDRLLRAAVRDVVPDPGPALREAVDAGVLAVAAEHDRYRFRHALLRAAVAGTLLPGEARAWHARWARALQDNRTDLDPLTTGVALARQWDAADEADHALPAAVAAAELCRRQAAFTEQAALLVRALRLWDRVPDAAERTGRDRAGLLHDAITTLIAADRFDDLGALVADELARSPAPDPVRAARLRILWATSQGFYAGPGELADVDALVDLLLHSTPSLDQVVALRELSWWLMFSDRPRAQVIVEEAVASADRLGDERLMLQVRCDRAQQLSWLGRPDENLRLVQELVPQLELLDPSRVGFALGATVSINAGMGRLDAALDALDVAVRRLGGPAEAPMAWADLFFGQTSALLDLGRWDEAQEVMHRCLAVPGWAEDPWTSVMAGLLALWRGNTGVAIASAARAQLCDRQTFESRAIDASVLWIRASVAARENDLTALRDAAREVSSRDLLGTEDTMLRIALVIAGAEADAAARARALGDTTALAAGQQAVADLRKLFARVHSPGPGPLAVRTNIDAELARWAGSTDPEPWQAAAAAWAPLGYPHERGWALLHLAEALVENARAAEAAEALADAGEIAERLGARPLAVEVDGLVRRARLAVTPIAAAPAPDTSAARLGLTGREREVLALLCEGLTNPAIGKRLFMSPKTVSVHVSHLLTKLGATNRTQAATIAHRLGLERTGG